LKDVDVASFWSLPETELFETLNTTRGGLKSDEALERLTRYGPNLLERKKRTDALTLLMRQFGSPIILILLFAVVLSFFLQDPQDATIILVIVLVSGSLGFWQERGAANAVEKLLAIVQIRATVFRDGRPIEIPVEEVVPGDVIKLNAGDIIPGDCVILDSKDLFVDEATLTGETYPVEKIRTNLMPDTPLASRVNTLLMGTNVVSGTAIAVVVHTGPQTEFGKVSDRLRLRPPETGFERGVRRFGYFLMELTMILVIAIFAINALLGRPALQSLLFSLAIAVGLTPQLLPAIVSVNLAHGSRNMAHQKVIVRRLASIENFGSMNVLCSDKTGTLTEGRVQLHSAINVDGNESEKALLYAYLNAFYETGFTNPIDGAIRAYRKFDLSEYRKLDEVPYDFVRKRLSILVSIGNDHIMVSKGALENVLSVCSHVESSDGRIVDISESNDQIHHRFEDLSSKGFRVLGIAYSNAGSETIVTREHETSMTFLGFLVFHDPPKPRITDTIGELKRLGISLKMITGDNRLVAASVSQQVGLSTPQIVTGVEIRGMSDEALLKRVNDTNVFAEVEPNQKERIILALRKAGNTIGYMGDGINDASALHAADVGISVDSAVDVAKEAADIVLLEKDLSVLVRGVREGRKTFANTLKYVFMATSANFGNMFSMAGASLFLPFLPMLPVQVLLMNLLTDFPEMTIPTDSVDKELTEKPRRWDIKFIRDFMATFGLLSSVFDYLTFGVLLFLLHAQPPLFRTTWFVESVLSASLIVLVVRTRRSFLRSTPSKYLLIATMLMALVTIALPFTSLGKLFEFRPLPIWLLLTIAMIVMLYLIAAEITKALFYRKRD
jgi:Mg2+-importing ATPase